MAESRLFSFVRHYYPEPLMVDHAEGVYVFDTSGRRYLDAYAGVATVSVGHANPRVCRRTASQAEKIQHTTMIYRTPVLEKYLSTLGTVMPDHLTRHFFVNSGSEAVDFAIQATRAHRRKNLIIALSEGFHGGSHVPASLTGLDGWQPLFAPETSVLFHPISSCRSCPEAKWQKGSLRRHPLETHCSAFCLDGMTTFFKENAASLAAILVEPVLGVGGILIPMKSYFERIQELAGQFDVDLICDEVQTGFGRCGKTLFAFERFGMEPDLLCLAKGIANGFPLGLVSGTEAISESMKTKLHFSTFGGNPVSCAAADETLIILLEEKLAERAEKTGNLMMEALDAGLKNNPLCMEIRGLGLMIGIELFDSDTAVKALEECCRRGLLIGLGGRLRNVIRIEPPLIFTEDNARQTAEIIIETLRSLNV